MSTATPTKPAKATEETDHVDSDARFVADLRRAAVDSGYAVVGVTDVAIERIRDAQDRVQTMREDLTSRTVTGELRKLQDTVTALPMDAYSASADAADRAEEAFDELATRGRDLVGRIIHADATRMWVEQAENAWSRSKAFMTTGRRTVTDTVAAGHHVAETAADGLADVAENVEEAVDGVVDSVTDAADDVSESVKSAAATTSAAATEATKTAKKRAARTRSAAKGAATSARKAAQAGNSAAQKAAAASGQRASRARAAANKTKSSANGSARKN